MKAATKTPMPHIRHRALRNGVCGARLAHWQFGIRSQNLVFANWLSRNFWAHNVLHLLLIILLLQVLRPEVRVS